MKIAIIGTGAISTYVQNKLFDQDIKVAAFIVRQGKEGATSSGTPCVSSVSELEKNISLLVDCAGHEALKMYGAEALEAGLDVLSVSLGALADKSLEQRLNEAAVNGGSKLHLTSGAIGGLDALRAASIGKVDYVKYTGRKPPKGWVGSPAQDKLDLDKLEKPAVHFKGSAREAAIGYPKNANVAAAVALSSLGFDKTEVELIADPTISANIHEIEARGDFGEMRFNIMGNSLPDNPRSSALAAMSVVSALKAMKQKIIF